MKEYDWLRDVSYDYGGSIVICNIQSLRLEEKLGIKYDHWVDEDGFDNCIDYFKVGNVSVTIYIYDSIIIESEKEEDVNKVLEYIDKAVS